MSLALLLLLFSSVEFCLKIVVFFFGGGIEVWARKIENAKSLCVRLKSFLRLDEMFRDRSVLFDRCSVRSVLFDV